LPLRGRTTAAFWAAFRQFPEERRRLAEAAYRVWREDPFHPSLHFKSIAGGSGLVSARVGRRWRVLGVREGEAVIWFWIGPHHEYEKLIGRG
jgi:hypothetical protein